MTQNLKRCFGSKYPGDKNRVLKEPHMEPLEGFNKHSKLSDGLQTQCRECIKAYRAEYKKTTKRTPAEAMTCLRCGQTKPNKDMVNHSSSPTGKCNLCLVCNRSRIKAWAEDNPVRSRKNSRDTQRRRRATKKSAAVVEKISSETLLDLWDLECYLCGQTVIVTGNPTEPDYFHHEHVIPLSRGGHESYANSRVSCRKCNGSKWTKTYWEVVLGWNGHWKNFTIPNLYLFNENAEWHYEQIFKTAREAATKFSKD